MAATANSTLSFGRGSPEELARVYERLPVMMYVVNRRGEIVDVNPYWLKRLGYFTEQVIGRPSAAFMPSGDSVDRQKVWEQLERAEDIEAWQVQYLSAAGEIVDGLLFGSPLLDADGRLEGAIATVFDVTAQRNAERDRDRLESELRLAQKLESIGQLAAGIAHEINTPSQYVSDNLSFLEDALRDLQPLLSAFPSVLDALERGAGAEVSKYRALADAADLEYLCRELPLAIRQSRDGIAQVKKIVVAMKDFSHPGADAKEALDLNRAIEATVTVARNEWKYVADLELSLDATLPHIEAIPSAINQVILNLVVNAAHAVGAVGKNSGVKGRIVVATKHDGESVEMSVTDTGCGIPAELRSRIFDPFFTTKEVGKGTGQGLAIVRRVVVERHSGTIDVESTVGQGTCFRVRLPVHAPSEEGKPA